MDTTADQINLVRSNTNEPERDTYSDDLIGGLVSSLGSVEAATADIWERKAAAYSELVNVSEAGASRSLGDLYKNATSMADRWRLRIPGDDAANSGKGRAKVHKIERF